MATLNYRFEVNKALNHIIVERIKSTYCNDSLTKNWIIWQHITNHCCTASFFLLQFGCCVIKTQSESYMAKPYVDCFSIPLHHSILFVSELLQYLLDRIYLNLIQFMYSCWMCVEFYFILFFACCFGKFFCRICCSLYNRTVQIFQAHTAQPQISMDLLWFLVMAFLAFCLFGFYLSNTSILTFFPRLQSILMARFQNHTVLWHMTNNGLRQRKFFRVDLLGSRRTKNCLGFATSIATTRII